jgi:hypothetical protein
MRPQGVQMSRGGPLPNGASRELPTTGTQEAREVPRAAASAVPQWESFPLPDRLRLVGLLIQTARRQVQPGPHKPTGRPKAEQG